MQNVSKFIVQAVIVSLCVLTVSIALFVYRTGSFSFNEMANRFSVALNSSGEPEFSKYAGKCVDGKTVRSVIEKFGGDYFIRIRTKIDSLSFCIYEKPYEHLINDGFGSYYDYTKSNSLFYVNESSLYNSTVYRNEGKTVIGILFEEQDSGSISSVVAQLYGVSDLLSAEQSYLQKVKEEEASMNSGRLDAAIETADKAIGDIENEIEKLLQAGGSEDDTVKETAARYTEKKDALDTASQGLEDAWKAYQEAFKDATGTESLGHYDITTNGISNNYDDLQYWVAKFSGDSGAGGEGSDGAAEGGED